MTGNNPLLSSPSTVVKPAFKSEVNQPVHTPVKPVQSSSSSSQPMLQLCSTYLEELRSEFNLRLVDSCPICLITVGRHARETVRSDNHQSDITESSPRSFNVAKAFRNLKSTSVLPIWKSNNLCHVFIADLKRCLKNSEIPESEWYRSFAYISDDFMVDDWIDRNLIDPEPHLTFEQACDKFRSHFESASAADLIAQEYSICHQKANETVQSYSDRFSSICARRGIQDSDPLAIQHFVEHLLPSISRNYRTQIGIAKANGQSPKVSTLTGVIAYAIALDIATQGNDSFTSISYPSSSSAKSCSFHPNSTSHSSFECRSQSMKVSSSPSLSSHVKSIASVVCYRCGQSGHFANRCSNPPSSTPTNSSRTSTSNAVNHSTQQHPQSVWRSIPPSVNSTNSEGLRRTSRSIQPPDRFSPSKYLSTRQPSVNTVHMSEESSSPVVISSENTVSVTGGHTPSDSLVPNLQLGCATVECLPTPSPMTGSQPASVNSRSYSLYSSPSEVLLQYQNRVYRVLLDTGATCSFISEHLAHELGIPIVPMKGEISLAHADCSCPRTGRTEPLSVSALFVSSKLNLPNVRFKHSFEILSLSPDRPFIIGTDLLPLLFPEYGIPLEFILRDQSSQISKQVAVHYVTIPQSVQFDSNCVSVEASSNAIKLNQIENIKPQSDLDNSQLIIADIDHSSKLKSSKHYVKFDILLIIILLFFQQKINDFQSIFFNSITKLRSWLCCSFSRIWSKVIVLIKIKSHGQNFHYFYGIKSKYSKFNLNYSDSITLSTIQCLLPWDGILRIFIILVD